MALNAYLALTQQLLQNPAAPVALYDPSILSNYINIARVQVAGEGQCIRNITIQPLIIGNYGPYSFLNFNASAYPGVQGILNIRTLWFGNGGYGWMTPRTWEWFALYNLSLSSLASPEGEPAEWSQLGQGATGSIYITPIPNAAYELFADSVCYPVALADDTTVEAIPPLWQTAVPYFAAYLALLSAQTSARMDEAEKMLQLYELFTARARQFANPEVMPLQYSQAIPSVRATQYMGGQQPARGGG